MITGYHAILTSVPSVREPGEHGPLSLAEIDSAVELMDRLAADLRAERGDEHRPPR
jgi:hypothetical protein